MTDESSSDQPLSDSDGANSGGFTTEDELDQILADAASLASDLSIELGEVETNEEASAQPAEEPAQPIEEPVQSTEDAASSGDISAQLDAELAALENLVADTSAELGDSSEPSPVESKTSTAQTTTETPAAQSDASTQPADPDHADEDSAGGATDADGSTPGAAQESQTSTKTEDQADEAASENDTKKEKKTKLIVSSPRPGVVGTGMLGVVTSEGVEDDKEEQGPPRPEWVEKLEAKVLPVALAACQKGVNILEKIDSPLSNKIQLSEQVRMIVGWAAIATIGTSLLIYIISFFYTP